MAFPLFFSQTGLSEKETLELSEETARHVIQVLRMQVGDRVELTDGNGSMAVATITAVQKKRCMVQVDEITRFSRPSFGLHLALAFTRNTSRNEWLLEKATEFGVSSIIPVVAERSVKEKSKPDRWNSILRSALIQSRNVFLPVLEAPLPIPLVLQRFNGLPQKLVGHCMEDYRRQPLATEMKPGLETIVLIGPEGDFTPHEVEALYSGGFCGINLGNQRLRTETAAMAVCAYFNLINYES